MASIQKRGSSYRVRITREGKKTISATFSSKKDALHWAAETESKIYSGSLCKTWDSKKTGKISFQEVANRYVITHSIHKKDSISEIGIIRRLTNRWEGLELKQIDKQRVLELRDELICRGRAGSTINHYFNAISKIFQMANDELQLIITNPITGLKRFPNNNGRTVRVNQDIEGLLISHCEAIKAPLLAHIIEFAIQTGMRRGEILGLYWTDIDIENQKAYLNKTKNGEMRQVPLTSSSIELLKKLPMVNDKVFPMTFDCLKSQFKRLKKYSEMRWVGYGENPFCSLRFHDLRHEALSRLSDAGLNVIELSHISGHKTLGMLKRYTHPSHTSILSKLNGMKSKKP